MPVLKIPAGEERGLGGLPSLKKSGEKEEDGQEKKENDDEEEEMEGKEEGWRKEEG